MKTGMVWMSPIETTCNEHEEQIHELSRKTAELETRADYKDLRINELIENNKRIEAKLDALNKTMNDVVVNSIKDDNDLKQRVVTLETQLKTQDDVLKQSKDEARKHREEDRAKTNQRLTYITVGVCVLTFILNVVLPYLLK